MTDSHARASHDDQRPDAASAHKRVRRPVILAVDDEPAVLAAVARDLRRGFGERYRILRASSGPEALDALRELRARGEQTAMLISDQRMPGMPGTDYLAQARDVAPDAHDRARRTGREYQGRHG